MKKPSKEEVLSRIRIAEAELQHVRARQDERLDNCKPVSLELKQWRTIRVRLNELYGELARLDGKTAVAKRIRGRSELHVWMRKGINAFEASKTKKSRYQFVADFLTKNHVEADLLNKWRSESAMPDLNWNAAIKSADYRNTFEKELSIANKQ